MQNDANLLDALAPIRVAIDALQKKIDDTSTQVGAEAYAAARTVYTLTKTPYASAVLRSASEDLAQRYGRTKKAKANPGPTPVPPVKPVPPPAPEPSPAPPKA
jgi:hypothetical protein